MALKEAQILIWERSNNPIARLEVYDKPNRFGGLDLSKTITGNFSKLNKYLKGLKKRRTIYISGHLDNTFAKGPIEKELSKIYHNY